MANPTPNTFVSAYKHYRVKLVENTPPWIIETRLTKNIIGHIRWVNGEWRFIPLVIICYTHTELLDIASCIKAVEKRTATPKLYR